MKKISCPRMYFTVTTIFMNPSLAINPSRIPIMTAMINLNMVLENNFFMFLFFVYTVCKRKLVTEKGCSQAESVKVVSFTVICIQSKRIECHTFTS